MEPNKISIGDPFPAEAPLRPQPGIDPLNWGEDGPAPHEEQPAAGWD